MTENDRISSIDRTLVSDMIERAKEHNLLIEVVYTYGALRRHGTGHEAAVRTALEEWDC